MENSLRDKQIAIITWLILLAATISTAIQGSAIWAGAMISFLIIMGVVTYHVPPKGIQRALNSINPSMEQAVFGLYIPFLLKHWKVVALLLITVPVFFVWSSLP